MSARELPVVIGVVLIIVMLVIPLPSWLLSILIMINISLALLVLLVSMNMKRTFRAIGVSVFAAGSYAVSIRFERIDNPFNFRNRRSRRSSGNIWPLRDWWKSVSGVCCLYYFNYHSVSRYYKRSGACF